MKAKKSLALAPTNASLKIREWYAESLVKHDINPMRDLKVLLDSPDTNPHTKATVLVELMKLLVPKPKEVDTNVEGNKAISVTIKHFKQETPVSDLSVTVGAKSAVEMAKPVVDV